MFRAALQMLLNAGAPPELSQPYFAHSANFTDTRCTMDNVQNLDASVGNTINNQVGVEDDVAVHAAFGGNMPTFGIIGVETVKPFDMMRNCIVIFVGVLL